MDITCGSVVILAFLIP